MFPISSFQRKSKVPSMESYPLTPITPQPCHYTSLMSYLAATLASFLLLTPAKLYPTSGNGTCCSLTVAPPCPFSFSSDGISLEKPFLMISSKVGSLSTSPCSVTLFSSVQHKCHGVITAYFCIDYCQCPHSTAASVLWGIHSLLWTQPGPGWQEGVL